ncbi:MAG: hypothetical protein ACP5UZ_02945 [Thermoplasmata archaeon]
MTEGEGEDSDPGGTSVLRVTCIEYMFGLRQVLQLSNGLGILSTVEVRESNLGELHSTVTEIEGGV